MQIPMIPFRISKTFGACAISFPEVYEVNLFANSIIAVIINRNIFGIVSQIRLAALIFISV